MGMEIRESSRTVKTDWNIGIEECSRITESMMSGATKMPHWPDADGPMINAIGRVRKPQTINA